MMVPRDNHSAGAPALQEVDLRRIEDALLEALLDVGAGRSNAVDRLLNELDAADGAHDDTASANARGRGFSRRAQVEQLLVAAVSDTHPDRNRALARLLDEIPDAPHVPPPVEITPACYWA